MRVLIAAGGTGGHIYPGIAVANELLSRNEANEVLFVGSHRGLECRIVPDAGFRLELINSAALKRVGLVKKLRSLGILPWSFVQALGIIRRFRPDVVVGAGGYVSGPVLLMASLLRYPTLVMDSNALPGFTNRRLAPFVTRAVLTFEDALPYFGRKGIVTGNPVRKEFFGIRQKETGSLIRLLVFGGSQGARGINRAVIEALPSLSSRRNGLRITHQTGRADLETVREGYRENGWEGVRVMEYISDMVSEFSRTDLIVCRAGATTCAELAAAGRPAVMVPLPTAADDHQRKNAEALERAGAAKMLLQKDLDGEGLARVIKELIGTPGRLREMGEAARKMAKADAASATVDIITELAGEKSNTAEAR